MKNVKLYGIILFLYSCPCIVNGQFKLMKNISPRVLLSLNVVLDGCMIVNNSGYARNLVVSISIKDTATQKTTLITSPYIKIIKGVSRVNLSDEPLVKQAFEDENTEYFVSNTTLWPIGNYEIQYILSDSSGNQLAIQKNSFSQAMIPPEVTSRLKDIQKKISGSVPDIPKNAGGRIPKIVPDTKKFNLNLFGAPVKLKGVIQFRFEDLTGDRGTYMYPVPNGAVTGRETVIFGTIPISCEGYYTTIRGMNQYNPSYITLSFSANEYQEELREKLKKVSGLEKYRNVDLNANKIIEKNLNEVKRLILDTSWIRKELKMNNLKKQLLADSNFRKLKRNNIIDTAANDSTLRNLESDKKKAIGTVQNGEHSWQAMQNRVEDYKKLTKEFESLDSMKSIREKLERKLDTLKKAERIRNKVNPELLNDPAYLKSRLKEYGLLKGPAAFLYDIQKFKVGKTLPDLSPNVLQGKAVFGLETEMTPGKYYIHLSGGTTQQFNNAYQVIPNLPPTGSEIAGIKGGYGLPEKTHIHLIFFKAADIIDRSLLNTNTFSPAPVNTNFIIGANSRIVLWKSYFVEGEVLHSDLYQTYNVQNYTSSLSAFLQTHYPSPEATNASDYSFSGRTGYVSDNGSTKVLAGISKINPDFQSMGVPYIQNNTLSYDAEFDQSFFQKKIQVNTFLRQLDIKLPAGGLNSTRMISASVSMRLENLPFIILNYSPFRNESTGTGSSGTLINSDVLTATALHTYRIGNFSGTSTLGYSGQNQYTNALNSSIRINRYEAGQTIIFPYHITFNAAVEYQDQYAADLKNQALILSGSIGYKFKNKLFLSGSMRHAVTINQYTNDIYIIKASYPYKKFMQFDLELTRNNFQNDAFNSANYKNFMIYFVLSVFH
jgi:hypothetical protein